MLDLAAHLAQSSMLTLSSGVAGWTRPVDEDADDPAGGLTTQLDVEHLEAVRLDDPLGHRPDLFDRLHPSAVTSQTHKPRARAHSV